MDEVILSSAGAGVGPWGRSPVNVVSPCGARTSLLSLSEGARGGCGVAFVSSRGSSVSVVLVYGNRV